MSNDDLQKLTDHLNEIKGWYHYSYAYSTIENMIKTNEVMREWADKHLHGKWYNYFSIWYFELESDYAMFLLRWS